MIDPLERWRAVRREARLRRPAHLRRRAVHAGPGRARRVRRRDRGRAHRRPRLGPSGHALRPAGDPGGELPARPAPRVEGGRVRGAEDRRLRRRGGAARRPGSARTQAIAELVEQVLDAGLMPIVLGGDHSIAEPDIVAVRGAPRAGRAHPLRHAHRHRPGGVRRRGLARDADVPARRGRAASTRERYVQIGLRGYWPGEETFAWQAEQGITSFFMHDVRARRDRGDRRADAGDRRRRARLPDRRRRRARPRLRARDRHAGAGRDDLARPALGLPHDRAPSSSSSAPRWSR